MGLRLSVGTPGARIVRASGRAARWTAPGPACSAAHCAVRSAGILESRVPVPKRSPEERGCEGDRTVDFVGLKVLDTYRTC